MSTLNLAKLLSAEYLLGLAISVAMAYAAFASWKAKAETRMDQMDKQLEVARQDHDTLIALKADIVTIKRNQEEIIVLLRQQMSKPIGK